MQSEVVKKKDIEIDNQSLSAGKVKKFSVTSLIILFTIVAISYLLSDATPTTLGWYTLVPTFFILACVFTTKQIMPAYILGGFIGHFMAFGSDFFIKYFETMNEVLMGESYIWLVLVCGMMSALMVMIDKSGGAVAFSNWVAKFVTTGKGALFWTWLMGVLMFVDDYLSCLAVGPSMSKVTDKHKVSREMLSYVVDSVAAAPCVLVPISTWAVFIAGLYEVNGYVPAGEGMDVFIQTIPYSFYAWFTILIVPLVIFGIIPTIGPMKKAELRAKTGVLAPEGSEKIDMSTDSDLVIPEKPKMMNLFLPLIVLVAATIYFEIDLLMGTLIAFTFTLVFFYIQKIVTIESTMESIVTGFKNMMFLFVLVALSYSFTATLEHISFASFIVENVKEYMNPHYMPFILFAVFGMSEFMTGSNWDIYMITFPVVLPLSVAVGGDPVLSTAAIISAGVFGSHVCVASDATICTSAATGCENFQHTISQMPYAMLAAGLTAITYLVVGLHL